MVEKEVLTLIASELMTSSSITVEGKSAPVRRTSRQRLRTAAFSVDGHQYQAVEQNPEKPSRWGQLARSGHQVVQFKDAERNNFGALVVDGKVTFYGTSKKWHQRTGIIGEPSTGTAQALMKVVSATPVAA